MTAIAQGPGFQATLRAAIANRGLPLGRIVARIPESAITAATLSNWQRGHCLPHAAGARQVLDALDHVLGLQHGTLAQLADEERALDRPHGRASSAGGGRVHTQGMLAPPAGPQPEEQDAMTRVTHVGHVRFVDSFTNPELWSVALWRCDGAKASAATLDVLLPPRSTATPQAVSMCRIGHIWRRDEPARIRLTIQLLLPHTLYRGDYLQTTVAVHTGGHGLWDETLMSTMTTELCSTMVVTFGGPQPQQIHHVVTTEDDRTINRHTVTPHQGTVQTTQEGSGKLIFGFRWLW